MTHVTCKLTAKNRDQLRNPTLGNRVWATFLCTGKKQLVANCVKNTIPNDGDGAVMITTTRMRSSNGTRVLFISRESGKDANKRCRKQSSSRTQNVLDRNYLTKKTKKL